MASPNEPSSSKRRLGRRRLPPLEPGPALQFVVANHPDQFRAGKTMRHVRSHVMYKHRTERKTSSNERTNTSIRRTASECASRTSSPAMTNSDASASDIDYLAAPQSRHHSCTWTGAPPGYRSYTSGLSSTTSCLPLKKCMLEALLRCSKMPRRSPFQACLAHTVILPMT
jgi:hypothetical protein